MDDISSTEPLRDLKAAEREAVDLLARDFAARRGADAEFDADGFFFDLRRRIEARAITLEQVIRQGPMGGGGPNEA